MPETTLTASAIIEGIRTIELSVADRVSIIRALRDATPGVVNIDETLLPRIRAAQAVDPEYIDTTGNALENSEVWQQSSSTTPGELRKCRSFETDQRPVMEELKAYNDMLKYNVWYNHYVGVQKSRNAYKVAKAMTGEAGRAIRHHLPIIAAARPSVGPKRRRTAEPVPPVVPPVTPMPKA